MERARDRLPLRRTPEQRGPEAELQVKRRRTASLGGRECQQFPRRSPQPRARAADFAAELRPAFVAETPRGG